MNSREFEKAPGSRDWALGGRGEREEKGERRTERRESGAGSGWDRGLRGGAVAKMLCHGGFLRLRMSEDEASAVEFPPPTGVEPVLHRAARLGDHAEIRRLVAAGADVNAAFNWPQNPDCSSVTATPLMIAAGSADGASVETVRLLVELGADPKVILEVESATTFALRGKGWGAIPLGGDAARARALVEVGSPLPENLGARNRLLCDVAVLGDAERLAILLERGFDPKGYWDQERAKERNKWVYRPDPNGDELHEGMSPETNESLKAARKQFQDETYERLTSGPSSRELPLFRAAESGNAECVRLLLKAGADAKARDYSGQSAMFCAATLATIEALKEAGLCVDDPDGHEFSPLDQAVGEGLDAIPRIKALIAAGANVNASHDRGYTVFMSACGAMARHPAILRVLVESGADPHAVAEVGYNAFHAAIDVNFEANREESVRGVLGNLKELGVNIEERNLRGHTPLARAIDEGTGREVRVLCELGANPNAVCTQYRHNGEKYVPVELPLLFHATWGSGMLKDEKTEALLKAGADTMAKDAEGFAPLHIAVSELSSHADDNVAEYHRFFEGVRQLRTAGEALPTTRDAFVHVALPVFREFVRGFAAEIPNRDRSQYADKWRQESIECISLLCAYESWARHIVRLQRQQEGEPTPPA